MDKREKVIKGLECCLREEIDACNNCPYKPEEDCDIEMMRDALALLKAQEPVEPKLGGNAGPFGTQWYQCGACSGQINPGEKYCSDCGRAVKWK